MPTMYNITLKQGASPEQIDKAKESAKSQGGTIKHEFTLIKGFTVEFPNETVHTLKTDDHIHVEQDGQARTQ
ncbi:MAG: hypothetical protein ALECFALPRED_005882 [Alectoria fallacina]|uniref:Inhibitor I9 domain-containing protein n=1 Tax=Alectoria fallacina TaxID=1903189 RepID=A0A8H3IN82_9LECA|nr:MAG: hypothetical protein ALECFALPRED_005882 [Alectoria fallacina]